MFTDTGREAQPDESKYSDEIKKLLKSARDYEKVLEGEKKGDLETVKSLVDNYRDLVGQFKQIGHYQQTEEYYQKAIAKYLWIFQQYNEKIKNNPKDSDSVYELGTSYHNWAFCCLKAEKYKNSAENYAFAVREYEKAVDLGCQNSYLEVNLLTAYTYLGYSYFKDGKYDESIKPYEKAKDKREENLKKDVNGEDSKNRILLGNNYLGLARCYKQAGDYEKASVCFLKAVDQFADAHKIFRKRIGESAWNYELYAEQAEITHNWAAAYYENNQYPPAIEKYSEALTYYKGALGLKNGEPNATLNVNSIYFILGIMNFDRRNYDEAILQYKKVEEGTEYFIYANHNIAACLNNQGCYLRAYELRRKVSDMYDREIEAGTAPADHYYYYGDLQHNNFNKLDEAEEIYLQGLQKDPDNENLHRGLFSLYLSKKNNEKSGKMKAGLDVARSFLFGKSNKLSRAQLVEKGRSVPEKQAAFWRMREEFDKLEELLLELVQHKSVKALTRLGDLYTKIENYKEAEKKLKQALEKEPEPSQVNNLLGVIYSRQKDFKRAARFFEDSLRTNPDDFDVRSNLAESYANLKLTDNAEREYWKVLNVAPGHVDSQMGIGELYKSMADLEEGDVDLYQKAIHHFDLCIRLSHCKEGSRLLTDKDLASLYYSRGYAKVKLYEAGIALNRSESLLHDARADFKRCHSYDPNDHKALRAKEKLDDVLGVFTNKFVEKSGRWVIMVLSFLWFLLIQGLFILNLLAVPDISLDFLHFTHSISAKVLEKMTVTAYCGFTLTSLMAMAVGVYLPNILKLKVGGIELEKSTVSQISPSTKLGIVDRGMGGNNTGGDKGSI